MHINASWCCLVAYVGLFFIFFYDYEPKFTHSAKRHQEQCSCHFPIQRPIYFYSKCSCAHLSAHGCISLKMRCNQVQCLAHHYPEAAENDCTTDQLKVVLKSLAQYFYFTVIYSKMRQHRRVQATCTLCLLHTYTQGHAAVHKYAKDYKGKDYYFIIVGILLLPLMGCSLTYMCTSRSVSSAEKCSFLLPDKSAIIITIHQGSSAPGF